MTKRRSKTINKGKGLTNGNGLTNGLTNGNGLVNGNGLNNKKSSSDNKFKELITLSIIFLVLMSSFGAFAIIMSDIETSKIQIDADFNDWDDVDKYENVITKGDMISVDEYAIYYEDDILNLYVSFLSDFDAFDAAPIDTPNYADIFLDTDDDTTTGYAVAGIGADYNIHLTGSNNTFKSSSLSIFSGTTEDEWFWTGIENVNSIYSSNKMECSVEIETWDTDSKLVIVTKNIAKEERTPIVSPGKTALVIEQSDNPSPAQFVLILKDAGGSPMLNTVTLSVPSGVLLSLSSSQYSINNNILTINQEITYNIRIEIDVDASGSVEDSVEIYVDTVDTDGICTIIGEPYKKYIGTGLKIDGIFNDWDNIQKYDEYVNDVSDIQNDNIDIIKFANTIENNNSYFYIEVTGDILEGTMLPYPEMISASTSSGTGSEIEEKEAYDYAKVTVDGHVIEIVGMRGKVLETRLDGISDSNIDAAASEGKLEIEWNGYEINGNYTIVMTDWSKNTDCVNSTDPPPVETTFVTRDFTPIPEFSDLILPMMSMLAISLIIRKRKSD